MYKSHFKDQTFNPEKQIKIYENTMKWTPKKNHHTTETSKQAFQTILTWQNTNKQKFQEIPYEQVKKKH